MKPQFSTLRLVCPPPLLRLQRRARTASSPLRQFTATIPRTTPNRLFSPVRSEDEFRTLLLLSASSDQPLVTLWTASFCPSCRIILPLLHDAIEKEGVGESEGGVGFAEVEVDAPGMMRLGTEYFINSMPTLLSFSRQEAQLGTKVTSVDEMKDREFLRLWIQAAAGGAGGRKGGLFGGLFGVGKST
ncbi:hypothetical protein MMC29_001188 [Sticta canariensis]|nr:hypothetical protein [Sticta canariensis]